MEQSYNDMSEGNENIGETDRIYYLTIDDNKELIFMENYDTNQDFGLFRDQHEESAIYEIEFQIYDKTKNIVTSNTNISLLTSKSTSRK
jgi:hypothetical protein